ncbi:hypothetical protein GXW82_37415 [Streptacidiphilus sp. 4-A2]|nr:hypothetical protein [Streptacidiphilus sp. 4-A2]
MKSATALRNRLARLGPEQLAELLETRQVGVTTARDGREPRDLGQLAELLLEDRSVAEAVSRLTLPSVQILGAAAWLATQEHGAPQSAAYWTPLEPSSRRSGRRICWSCSPPRAVPGCRPPPSANWRCSRRSCWFCRARRHAGAARLRPPAPG